MSGSVGNCAPERDERDEVARLDGVRDPVLVPGAVALGQVHREPLVEPARREPVRVLDRGVEHEVGQLVRDDDADPGVVDGIRVMSANSVRMSAWAWPPTFSRVPGPSAVRNAVSSQ